MSTIDPRVARAEKLARTRGSGRSLGVALVVGAVHLALWTLAGYGFGMIYDTPRLMALNQVGDGWDSPFGTMPLWFILGVVLGSIVGFVFGATLGRLAGGAVAFLAPLVTGSFGLALGLGLFYPAWTPPQSYGEQLGFLPGDPSTPWDTVAWINYALPLWLPAMLAVFGALVLVIILLVAGRARRKAARMAQVIDSGRRVRGAVTEVRATGTEINGMPYLEFTVGYRDHLGTDRWVTKKSTFPQPNMPRAGDPALVWYDPATIDDQKQIVVGLGPEAAVAD